MTHDFQIENVKTYIDNKIGDFGYYGAQDINIKVYVIVAGKATPMSRIRGYSLQARQKPNRGIIFSFTNITRDPEIDKNCPQTCDCQR